MSKGVHLAFHCLASREERTGDRGQVGVLMSVHEIVLMEAHCRDGLHHARCLKLPALHAHCTASDDFSMMPERTLLTGAHPQATLTAAPLHLYTSCKAPMQSPPSSE